jgi:superoxide dismutase, Cu-Zn family
MIASNARRLPIGGLLLTALVLGACAPDNDAPGDTRAATTEGAVTAGTPGAPGTAQAGHGIERTVGATHTARFIDLQGQEVGEVTLTEGPEGVFVTGQIRGLAAGPHGFHFHETGLCDPPFQSAGGHFNPGGRQHGLASTSGPHAGDMANLFAGGEGATQIEAFAPLVTLGAGPNSLLDGDGTAIVVHAARDDQRTDPSGNSGDRIACAVLTRG